MKLTFMARKYLAEFTSNLADAIGKLPIAPVTSRTISMP
jgi:hypothetical protein